MEDLHATIARQRDLRTEREQRCCFEPRRKWKLLEPDNAELELFAWVGFQRLRWKLFASSAQHAAAHRAAEVFRWLRRLSWVAELWWLTWWLQCPFAHRTEWGRQSSLRWRQRAFRWRRSPLGTKTKYFSQD